MKKLLLSLLISSALTLCVLVVLIFTLSSFIFSKASVLPEKPKVNFTALASANKKIQDELSYMTRLQNETSSAQKGEVKQEDLISDNYTRKIKLTSDELNALLTLYASGSQAISLGEKVFSVVLFRYVNGEFYFAGTKEIPFDTPFGNCINVRSKFILDINESVLKVTLLSFKAGDIPAPKFLINYYVNREQKNINSIPLIQELLYSIKELSLHKDKIVIVYYPKKFLKVMSRLVYSV